MAAISVTNTFSAGAVIYSAQVNTNFSDIIAGLSDGTKDISVSGITAAGTATLNGPVILGNAASDALTPNGVWSADMDPGTTNTYDLGSSSLRWKDVYCTTLNNSTAIDSTKLDLTTTKTNNFILNDPTTATKEVDFDVSGATASTKTTLTFVQTANRTVTFPDAAGTVTILNATQTLSAKTYSGTLTLAGTPVVNAGTIATWQFTGSDTGLTFQIYSSGANSSPALAVTNDVQTWVAKTDGASGDDFVLRDSTGGRDVIRVHKDATLVQINGTDAGFTLKMACATANSTPAFMISNDAQSWVLKNDGASADDFVIRDSTGGADVLRIIKATGEVGIGVAPAAGYQLTVAGTTRCVKAGVGLVVDRTGSDGTLVEFNQDGTTEGSISVSGTTVAYNAFFGAHITQGDFDGIPEGSIISSIDKRLDEGFPGRQRHVKSELSSTPKDPAVLGVYHRQDDIETRKGGHYVGGLGSYIIRVMGPISVGDLITSSSIPGVGMSQGDDIIRSYTVAKARESWPTATEGTIACTLIAG